MANTGPWTSTNRDTGYGFVGTSYKDKMKQMNEQEKIIEQKKRIIQEKLEAAQRKQKEQLDKQLDKTPGNTQGPSKSFVGNKLFGKRPGFHKKDDPKKFKPEEPRETVPKPKLFVNDGNFLERFKQIHGMKSVPVIVKKEPVQSDEAKKEETENSSETENKDVKIKTEPVEERDTKTSECTPDKSSGLKLDSKEEPKDSDKEDSSPCEQKSSTPPLKPESEIKTDIKIKTESNSKETRPKRCRFGPSLSHAESEKGVSEYGSPVPDMGNSKSSVSEYGTPLSEYGTPLPQHSEGDPVHARPPPSHHPPEMIIRHIGPEFRHHRPPIPRPLGPPGPPEPFSRPPIQHIEHNFPRPVRPQMSPFPPPQHISVEQGMNPYPSSLPMHMEQQSMNPYPVHAQSLQPPSGPFPPQPGPMFHSQPPNQPPPLMSLQLKPGAQAAPTNQSPMHGPPPPPPHHPGPPQPPAPNMYPTSMSVPQQSPSPQPLVPPPHLIQADNVSVPQPVHQASYSLPAPGSVQAPPLLSQAPMPSVPQLVNIQLPPGPPRGLSLVPAHSVQQQVTVQTVALQSQSPIPVSMPQQLQQVQISLVQQQPPPLQSQPPNSIQQIAFSQQGQLQQAVRAGPPVALPPPQVHISTMPGPPTHQIVPQSTMQLQTTVPPLPPHSSGPQGSMIPMSMASGNHPFPPPQAPPPMTVSLQTLSRPGQSMVMGPTSLQLVHSQMKAEISSPDDKEDDSYDPCMPTGDSPGEKSSCKSPCL
ncbi:hypothetical protein ScPMuIL_017646 [Solemya velum]